MGFLSFIGFWPAPVVDRDVTIDLTTKYPPRRSFDAVAAKKPAHIPLELIFDILETAYFDDNLQPDVQLLSNCSLVCKDWSAPAQRLLFRHVSLKSETAFLAFQGAVDRSTARGRTLSDAVVRLCITLDHNQPHGLTQHSFAHAVCLCPNLYELTLALYGRGAPGDDVSGAPDAQRMARPAPSFDAGTLAQLRAGPPIAALHLSNWSENSTATLQLLDIWPGLTALALQGTPPPPPPPAAPPPRCALRELHLNFQAPPSADFARWLLHTAARTGSLRVLELAREPPPDLLDALTHTHGPALLALALPACGGAAPAAAVARCTRLRELRIERPWAAPALFRRLPRTLEHLALGVDADTPLHAVADAVRGAALPRLRALTLQLWAGGPAHALLPALRMACAVQGVAVACTRDVRRFRALTRGDPVPAESFPRGKSLANLQTMLSAAQAASRAGAAQRHALAAREPVAPVTHEHTK